MIRGKYTKKLITISCIMICVGIIICFIGVCNGGATNISLDLKNGKVVKESKERYKEKVTLDAFNSIQINCNSNIEILKSDKYKLDFDVPKESGEVNYSVKDNKLIISQSVKNKVNINFDFNFDQDNLNESYIKIYVPTDIKIKNMELESEEGNITIPPIENENIIIKSDYGNVLIDYLNTKHSINIKMNNGKLDIRKAKAENINIFNDYGNVKLSNVDCNDLSVILNNGQYFADNINSKNYILKNEYGNNELSNSISEKLKINVDNGTLKINEMDSGNTEIINDYGKILAEKLNTTSLIMKLGNGDVKISGIFKGTSIITSEYGNVSIDVLAPKEEYNYYIKNDYGKIIINNKQYENYAERNEKSNNELKIHLDNGRGTLNFR